MFVQGKQQPPQTNEPVQVLLTVADTEKHFDCIKGNGKASKLPKKKKSHFFHEALQTCFGFSASHTQVAPRPSKLHTGFTTLL